MFLSAKPKYYTYLFKKLTFGTRVSNGKVQKIFYKLCHIMLSLAKNNIDKII